MKFSVERNGHTYVYRLLEDTQENAKAARDAAREHRKAGLINWADFDSVVQATAWAGGQTAIHSVELKPYPIFATAEICQQVTSSFADALHAMELDSITIDAGDPADDEDGSGLAVRILFDFPGFIFEPEILLPDCTNQRELARILIERLQQLPEVQRLLLGEKLLEVTRAIRVRFLGCELGAES